MAQDQKHFNQLTPAEAERLAYLIEELAEAQQAACKILRHGYNSYHPDRPQAAGNRHDLNRELTDVVGAMIRMIDARDILPSILLDPPRNKGSRYMHHQD